MRHSCAAPPRVGVSKSRRPPPPSYVCRCRCFFCATILVRIRLTHGIVRSADPSALPTSTITRLPYERLLERFVFALLCCRYEITAQIGFAVAASLRRRPICRKCTSHSDWLECRCCSLRMCEYARFADRGCWQRRTSRCRRRLLYVSSCASLSLSLAPCCSFRSFCVVWLHWSHRLALLCVADERFHAGTRAIGSHTWPGIVPSSTLCIIIVSIRDFVV